MDKIDRLIKLAKEKVPVRPAIDFSYATTNELLELINESTTKERFNEIIYELVDRASKAETWEGLWNDSD